MKYTIDFDGLRAYLIRLKATDFCDADSRRGSNQNGLIKPADTIDDIEHFKIDKSKITLDTVIFYGMPFLRNVGGNDLSVIELSKRKYKLPNGRYINAKFVKNIINNCHLLYGTALNGYWTIPPQFIKYD